jgi:NADH dehydrogenase
MGDVGQIVPMPCAVRSDASVAGAIGNSDAVINLIGILFQKGRDTFQAVHVETAARIARLAREQGASHLVHMSALGANEQSTSAYARSKAAGERAVRAFFPESVIMRPGILFGPEDNFFNLFATMARYSPVLPLIGGGGTRFQPVYVGNVADAIAQSLQSPEARGRIFELAGPQVYSFRELLVLMLKIIGRKRCLMNLPFPLATFQGLVSEMLPMRPLITRDQVELLKSDNVIHNIQAAGLRDLGVAPTALELILPTYLGRFQKG